MVVDANLAVHITTGSLTIDLDEGQLGISLLRFYAVEKHYSVVCVHNVNATCGSKRCSRTDVVVHIVGQRDGSRHLLHRCLRVGSICHAQKGTQHCDKCKSFHIVYS